MSIVLASLPPFDMVSEAFIYGLFLPLLAAGIVFAACSRAGKGGQVVGAILAVVAGFAVGNHFRQATEYRIDVDRPFSVVEFASEGFHAVSGASDDAPGHPPARYWLPWAALFAAGVGVFARTSRIIGRAMRVFVIVLIARLLVPANVREEFPWLWVAFAVAVPAEWELLETFGEDSSRWLLLGLGIVLLGAGAVQLHAQSARLTDLATMLAGSCFGVVLAAWWTEADLRGALPIVAVALPGLMLIGQQSTFSEVPLASFALVALAPLSLTPLLLMRNRSPRARTLAGLGLLLITVGVAVVLAAWAEPLSFD